MITWFEKHNKISWAITILGAILIFYISSLTFAPSARGFTINATFYHFSAFFLFAFFLLISITKGKSNSSFFILAIIIAVLYGISDEFHQFFVPGRACSLYDVFVDTAGVLTASVLYLISLKYRRKHKNPKNPLF